VHRVGFSLHEKTKYLGAYIHDISILTYRKDRSRFTWFCESTLLDNERWCSVLNKTA